MLGERQPFPRVVFAPVLPGVQHKTTEKLVFEADETLHILKRIDGQVKMYAYPFDAICDIEVGNILLYSWITLRGVTREGATHATPIEFNSTSRQHFAPFVAQLRPRPSPDPQALRAKQTSFSDLASKSFKFMNYARSSLVSGEKVIHTLWQPEIQESILPWRWLPFTRTIATAHLTILTDKELILIREDERSSKKDNTRYGGVWHYIPLRSIDAVAMTSDAADWLILSIGLTSAGRVEGIFAPDQRPEVEQFQHAVAQLTGASVM